MAYNHGEVVSRLIVYSKLGDKMIDDTFLSGLEGYTGNLGNTHAAEIIRNARRYLELKKQFAPFSMDVDGNHSWCWRGNPSRMKGPTLDAAADRLLESGE